MPRPLVYLALVLAVLAVATFARAGAFVRGNAGLTFPLHELGAPGPRPGDLVMFATTAHGFHNSIITNSYFSHASVVTDVLPDDLTIIESVRGGVRRTTLRGKLPTYKGLAYWVPRLVPLDASDVAALRQAADGLEGSPYLTDAGAIMRALFKPNRLLSPHEGVHCFQLAALMLDAAENGNTRSGSGPFSSIDRVLAGIPPPTGRAEGPGELVFGPPRRIML